MPIRKTPLETDYYYHLFNRSVAKVPIFTCKRDFIRAMGLLNYYRFKNAPLSYSRLMRLDSSQREDILKKLEENGEEMIEIICFCLMPNHFHLLLKQLQDDGIMIFLKNFQNSYAKYFNMRYQRPGSLFQGRFKAVLIEDDSQLLHVSRYAHLNPYSSMVVKDKKDLLSYPWSSLLQYLKKSDGFCRPEIVLEQFKSSRDYLNFVFDRADYQRSLEKIKHLTCE